MLIKKLLTRFCDKKLIIPLLIALVFCLIFGYHSIYKHQSYNSYAFDLGIYTQISYLYSQGLTPFSTLKHMPLLADHFELVLLLLSPIYRILPSPITLLIIQALFVALSSIPIYLIALDKLKSKLLSSLICLTYLSSVGITSAINFDFHSTTISVLPISLILFGWHFSKWRFYLIMLILAVLFKEDLTIFLFGLGVFQILKQQTKVGILTIVYSVLSFLLIKFIIMPFIWPGSEDSYIGTSILPLTSPLDLLSLLVLRPAIFLDQIFNSPIKLSTLHTLYGEYSFLPLISPLSWLTVFPELYLRFSSILPHFWGTEWHYNSNLEPVLAISTILAVANFKLPKLPICLLLTILLLLNGLSVNGFVVSTIKLDPTNLEEFSQVNQALENIPEMASVSAQSPLVPHLSNRIDIYLFPEIYNSDYIVLDTKLTTYPLDSYQLRQKISALESSHLYSKQNFNNGLLIFKRNH